MKFTFYLSLSTLICATGSATLRGSDGDEMVAPPRVFDEQKQQQRQILPSSSKWTHREEEEQAPAAVSSSSHGDSTRTLQCNSNQLLRVTLSPDVHSDVDNKFIVSIQENNGSWRFLDEKSGTYDGDFTMCLSPGRHKFEAIDSYSDGIKNGGSYKVTLGGSIIFRTPGGEWSRTVHKFDVLGNEQPAPTTGDRAGDREDPDFKLMRSFGTAIPTSVAVFSPPNPPNPPNPAPPTTKPSPNPPTPPSEPQGNVELVGNQDHQVDNNEVVASGSGNVSAGVMTDRDKLWLKEHNDRRQLYHTKKGVSYKPLKWSAYLKDSAQKWAKECAETGVFDHSWHLTIGENMAKHTSTYGDKPPSNILTRWVEDEMNYSYPDCGHMTQVLWRGTEYVGCGEARSGNTYIQVCHYSKPGNCEVNTANFWTSVLADYSGCNGMPLLY